MSTKTTWETISPYVVPPIAAGGAIVPVFYGFAAKSAKQQGESIPRMGIVTAIKEGCKATPTIGAIVGTQMIAQMITENGIKSAMKKMGFKEKEIKSFAPMVLSSIIVGGVSAPMLAIFNGQTMGKTPTESLKALCRYQVSAIIARETSFLFSLRVSEPVSEKMEETFGKSKKVEYISTFASGAIGSLIGHPADTALTLWQKGKKIETVSKTKIARQLMQGGAWKAGTVGAFSMCYKTGKEFLMPKNRE